MLEPRTLSFKLAIVAKSTFQTFRFPKNVNKSNKKSEVPKKL